MWYFAGTQVLVHMMDDTGDCPDWEQLTVFPL